MQLIENTVVELFKKVRRKVGILRFILSGDHAVRAMSIFKASNRAFFTRVLM